MHTAGNSVSPQGYNFNPYLKVGHPNDLQEFQDFSTTTMKITDFLSTKTPWNSITKCCGGSTHGHQDYHQTETRHRPDGNDPQIDVETLARKNGIIKSNVW